MLHSEDHQYVVKEKRFPGSEMHVIIANKDLCWKNGLLVNAKIKKERNKEKEQEGKKG